MRWVVVGAGLGRDGRSAGRRSPLPLRSPRRL